MLHTFTLSTGEYSIEDRYSLIKDLYNEILKNDAEWHFFYEDEFGDFLRVSERYSDRVEKFLRTAQIEYELNPVWIEELPAVNLDLEYFKALFHLNSVFSIIYSGDDEELESLLHYFVDRYSHSLHNVLHLRRGGGVMGKEAENLSKSVRMRAWYDGYRYYYLQAKGRIDGN